MSKLSDPCSGHSLITAILPRQHCAGVIDDLLSESGRHVMTLNARGTLIKDRWYQSFVPVMNPEQEVLQVLVPSPDVDYVMQQIIVAGRLHLSGSGAIYSIACDGVCFTEEHPRWYSREHDTVLEKRTLVSFKKDLVGIFCIAEGPMTGAISRAAVQVGAPGPTIHYCTGRGLRDRLLLLRITKDAEKEFMQLVVDNCDAEPVFDAMTTAGRIDEPGRGFIYRVPIEKGLINIGSVFGPAKHSASIQQIISAIDKMQGSSEWRSQAVLDVEAAASAAGIFGQAKVKKRKYLENFTMLNCVTSRAGCSILTDAALAAGAPGAAVSHGRFMASECERTKTGVRLNQERGIIRTMLPSDQVRKIREAMGTAAEEQDIPEACFYSHPVTKAITYMGD